MKKSLKKIIMVVLTFAMMFAMTVPAYAKEAFKILKTNATIYSSKTMENRRCYNPDERIAYIGKRKVVVESSNTKVATVDSKGVVTAKAAGTANITATLNGKTATYKVTVKNAMSINKTAVTVYVGGTPASYTLKATSAIGGTVKYATSNKNQRLYGFYVFG